MSKIPASFIAYLNHPMTILHGVNIKNDLRKLERDFPHIKADPLIEKCVELGTFYNQVFNSSERWSLANLALQTLKQKVDKSRHVRQSNWNYTLSEKQLMYASLDVYVSISYKAPKCH
jgi:ribonuclease D